MSPLQICGHCRARPKSNVVLSDPVRKPRRRRPAGVVDKHIHRTELRFNRRDARLDERQIRNVPFEREALYARRLDSCLCAVQTILGDVGQGDVRALAGKGARDGAAKSAAGSEDERGFIFETKIHGKISFVCAARSAGVFDDVHPAIPAIDQIETAVVVSPDVVRLDFALAIRA